jgi:peptidase E
VALAAVVGGAVSTDTPQEARQKTVLFVPLANRKRTKIMFKNEPKKRLKMYDVGSQVQLLGVETNKPLTVKSIRADGYYELINDKGRLVVTASPGHEVK